MAVFEMRNARKAFDALEVLKGVSLKVEKGEVVSIIGPSGGGSSGWCSSSLTSSRTTQC